MNVQTAEQCPDLTAKTRGLIGHFNLGRPRGRVCLSEALEHFCEAVVPQCGAVLPHQGSTECFVAVLKFQRRCFGALVYMKSGITAV